MLRKMLVTLVLAGVATVAAGETVYKWVDSRGQVHYTDLPPRESGARLLSTYQGRVGVPAGDDASEPAEADTLPPGFSESDAPDGATRATAAAVQRDVAAQRAEQCTQAQARYKQYIESQRLFRTTPDGQRQYLSDAELTQARIDAKKAVDEYCGPGSR
ncbi:MAG: DUF4124 domain-containing protein [Steroidobacteraceae bacterium]|nr:DUF4124 domain-containing protein [Steroidobacteraceae bacterium]